MRNEAMSVILPRRIAVSFPRSVQPSADCPGADLEFDRRLCRPDLSRVWRKAPMVIAKSEPVGRFAAIFRLKTRIEFAFLRRVGRITQSGQH